MKKEYFCFNCEEKIINRSPSAVYCKECAKIIEFAINTYWNEELKRRAKKKHLEK